MMPERRPQMMQGGLMGAVYTAVGTRSTPSSAAIPTRPSVSVIPSQAYDSRICPGPTYPCIDLPIKGSPLIATPAFIPTETTFGARPDPPLSARCA